MLVVRAVFCSRKDKESCESLLPQCGYGWPPLHDFLPPVTEMGDRNDLPVTFSRKTLYDQVWQTPMARLAPRYGLSDVGLAKICRKHQIPLPPRGHWARLEHGKRVRQPPLPEIEDEDLQTVVIDPQIKVMGRGARPVEGVKREHLSVEVPEDLRNPHPLVKLTAKSLRAAKPDYRGMVRPAPPDDLDVYVSKGQMRRAMRILDALFKALEEQGATIRVANKQWQKESLIDVGGETIPISLKEEYRTVEKQPTAAEKRKRDRWSFRSPEYEYEATGRLVLSIATWHRQGVRGRWADGKKQRVEDLLGKFVEAVLHLAGLLKEETRKRREAQERQEAWEQQRAEKLKLIEEEENRVKRLLSETDSWHRSKQVRSYIDDVIRRVEEATGPIDEGSGTGNWIAWATAQADRLDPLIEGPPSILDEKGKWEGARYRGG